MNCQNSGLYWQRDEYGQIPGMAGWQTTGRPLLPSKNGTNPDGQASRKSQSTKTGLLQHICDEWKLKVCYRGSKIDF